MTLLVLVALSVIVYVVSALYLERRMEQEVLKYAPAEMVFAIHIRAADRVHGFAQTLADAVNFPLEDMIVGEAGPALSCHGGPGVLAAGIVAREA